MKHSYTIIVDDREKKPLVFPKNLIMLDSGRPPVDRRATTVSIEVVRARLNAGDYTIEGGETSILVERKGSFLEVARNCLIPSKRERFLKNLADLKSTAARPILFFEVSPSQITSLDPEDCMGIDALQRLLHEHRIELHLFTSNTSSLAGKQTAGLWLARTLINAVVA